jgi:hypothetical protein
VPFEMIAQVPGVLPLQYWHEPLQAVLQQTVSTQLPLKHWLAVWQVWPFLLLQVPLPSQVWVPEQALFGSSAFVTLTQVPPLPVQAWQLPHADLVQQNPSTQLPLPHSTPVPHVAPLAFVGVQTPAAQ